MNAKKCKAMRRIIGRIWNEVVYHVPPLVPVFAFQLGKDGKLTDELVIHHYRTATVTLSNCGHRMYHLMKKAYKNSTSMQGAYA